MPWTSRWMMIFGAVCFACALAGWRTEDTAVRAGAWVGVAMIAAGAAVAQGRRSLRKSGGFVGMFLPVLAAGLWGWRAWDHYRGVSVHPSLFSLILLLIMAVSALLMVTLVTFVRSSDNIAERGYSVTPLVPDAKANPPPSQSHRQEHL